MKNETLSVRFLYKTFVGRCILKVLVQPPISKGMGKLLETSCSRWIIPSFVKRHHIDMSEYQGIKFKSFNDFFTRKRDIDKNDYNEEQLLSPCDGHLSVYPINKEQKYQIKHVSYSLERLLEDSELAKRYANGTCLIFRLTPQDYHRYIYVCDGIREKKKTILGKLHCVRPLAYTSRPVFIENSREYTVIRSKHFGKIVQMEVGALLVGKIHNHDHQEVSVQGQEKGYFEFGGSTIILLLEKDQLVIREKLMKQMLNGQEVRVKLGDVIGDKLV